ncbi:MAG: NAD(P)H-dependent oxidoreductase [Bacteroidales bacterium]|nr:NAD(P)H-dependent oxidoreductase [Bacteroidales bacterium]
MKLVNMKKIITLLLAIFATVAFVSCEKATTSEDTDPQKEEEKKPEDYDRIIIVTPLWWSNMAAIMQSYLFQSGSKMEGKTIGLIVSSYSSSISEVVKDAKRLVPKGNFYEESLWINNSNHSKRADLVKEWLASNQKTQ